MAHKVCFAPNGSVVKLTAVLSLFELRNKGLNKPVRQPSEAVNNTDNFVSLGAGNHAASVNAH